MGVRWVGVALGVVALVAGCGKSGGGGTGTTTSSAAATTTTTQAAALWDPCTLPESALRSSGLDPASKQTGLFGDQFPGSKTCAWRSDAKWYDLSVYSINRTLQEVRERPDFEQFTPTTVGSHEAVQFFETTDPGRQRCGLAVGLKQGIVIFQTLTRYSAGKQGDPCVEARRHADDLVKFLPAN
ncbi:DUF3558 domain-containing protein [Nocardia sp. CDC159]|uniref:DUF3558 domain-containing protein n=2 Tax=Nocardiaceae TaxID=85025 RepID=A0A9X2E529_9NOCA|nr:DUF3558 domain-containing protein [Nocardia pulmonis]MCM6786831.1 DUF3558 domain-containing protein [Nocardia sp. CDC159]